MKIVIISILGIILFTSCVTLKPGAHIPLLNGECPYSHPIKGNIDSYLYHTEASSYYNKTKAEVCFQSTEQARRAGFYPPKNR